MTRPKLVHLDDDLDSEAPTPRSKRWSAVGADGRKWRCFATSAPEDEIALYDDVARELRISRSALIRVALRQFCAAVKR